MSPRAPDFDTARGGVYYLHGADEFRKGEAVRRIVDAHLDPATADFNFDQLRGTEVDSETLASVIATPPMMAEWRVVVVRDTEGLASSSKARDTLLATTASPPAGLALVLSCTVPSGSRAKLYRELASKAQSVEFKSVADADVPGWLMERARTHHDLEFDVDAAQALGAAIGPNLGVLTMELQKLEDFVGHRRRVSLADIEAAGTSLPEQDRWRWFDLVGEGDFDRALAALSVLFAQGESGVGLVIGLTSHLLRLGIVAERGAGALEAALPPHQKWLARKFSGQGKRWRPVEIDAALEGLLRADRLLKGSPMKDQHLIEEWLLTVMARRAAA